VRILLAGATGVIGRALLPLLLEQGHEVVALCRSPDKLEALRAQGAEAVAADALDADALGQAVADARPQAVIHQLTAIPAQINPRTVARDFALNDRLRTEGTANLLAAAKAAGAERFIAQSIAFAYAPGPAGTVHTERDALLSPEQAPKEFRRSAGAVADLEREVLGAGGVVLRYGYFYGPGSAIARDGSMAAGLAHRRMPVVGSGSGVWSFIHVADAASATAAALDLQGPAVLNVVDDEPARVAEWIPALGEALGTPSPRRVPTWLARLVAGAYGTAVMTRAQGASNAAARAELPDWSLSHPSWREGFRTGL
jgi:nucleoside-diphosphate-sugar epimerase